MRFDGVVGEQGVVDIGFVGVGSSIEALRECPGVPGRLRFHGADDSCPTRGLGNGVRSDMAERYGDGRAELAEPGESDEGILAVERVERSDEPLAGKLCAMGEAKVLCSLVWTGVSHIVGVSFVCSSTGLPVVPRSV